MKKHLLIALMGICFLGAATTAKAQPFVEGTKHLNVGIGFGGYYGYAYSGSDFSQIPTIFLAYDQGTAIELGPGVVGIGGFLGYSAASASYAYAGTYSWDYTWTNFVIGARGTYHYPLANEKLDVYGGLGIGIWSQAYKFSSNDPFFPETNDTYINLYYAFSVGGKYMLSEKFGVFAELGYDIAYLKAGVTLGL